MQCSVMRVDNCVWSVQWSLVAGCDEVLCCLLRHSVRHSSTIEQLHSFVRQVYVPQQHSHTQLRFLHVVFSRVAYGQWLHRFPTVFLYLLLAPTALLT